MASTSLIRIHHGMFAGNYVYAVCLTLLLVNMREICPYQKACTKTWILLLFFLCLYHSTLLQGSQYHSRINFSHSHAQVLLLEDHGYINLMTKSVYDFCFLVVRDSDKWASWYILEPLQWIYCILHIKSILSLSSCR